MDPQNCLRVQVEKKKKLEPAKGDGTAFFPYAVT
jgi:hypothetical protein